MQKHEEWLRIAKQDLALAQLGLRAGDTEVFAPSIYHTQQAAEKALKAYLAFHRQEIPKVHDLMRLLKACVQFDIRFSQLNLHAAGLNVYSTATRYPDDLWHMPDRDMLAQAIVQAEEIINLVCILCV